MKEMGSYDTEMKMFVEPPHEMDIKVAESIKWGVDNGKYEEDIHADVVKLADVRAQLAEMPKD